MGDKKFKIGSIFRPDDDIHDGMSQVQQFDDDDETYGAWGVSHHYITRQDISHLLRGGIIGIDDGEYEHYLRLKKE